jgi:hypothetical protein
VWLAVLAQREGVQLPPFVAEGFTQRRLPEGPLVRMARGLQALGPMVGAPGGGPGEGDGGLSWVWAAPLWGNPLLPGLPHSDLALLPGMGTVGGAVGWWADMQPWLDGSEAASQPTPPRASTQSRWEAWWRRRLGERAFYGVLVRPLVVDRGAFLERFCAVRAAVPAAWWAAAEAVRGGEAAARPRLGTALAAMCKALGWRQVPAVPGGTGARVPLLKLTVRAGTALQQGPLLALRRGAHAVFIAAATGAPVAGVVPAQHVALHATLQRAWALKWENQQKEVLWRMTVQGVRGVAAHGLPTLHPCPCGGLAPGACAAAALQHHFWSCPVAAAVVGELQRGWAAGEGALSALVPSLRREDVWLLAPPVRPSGGQQQRRMHGGVWAVVCLAALTAMDHGRRALVSMHLAREEAGRREEQRRQQGGGGRQLSLYAAWGLPPPPPPPLPSLVPRAAGAAAARFWSLLADFAELGVAHKSWDSLAGEGHPYLVRHGEGVRVVVPP